MSILPKDPFNTIALCMSGGGYRAASFHLGAMSYLERVNLLERVKAISTVSGGTITGVMYAMYKEKGESFQQIYDRLISLLRTRNLIKEGLSKLKLDGEWNNSNKRRNLINAFSEIYNEHFTQGGKFGELMSDPLNSHLRLVVFNATEFNHGINFRFQNRGMMGNNYIKVPKIVKGEILLADIIAASSCFPGGFEPIGFPGDFIHENATELRKLKENKFVEDVGLLDGGIYDNQGIDAILLSEQRSKKVHDLIIISDVSSPDMVNFTFYKSDQKKGIQTKSLQALIQQIKRITVGVTVVLVLLIIGSLLIAWAGGFQNNISTGIGLSLLSISLVSLITFYFLRSKIKKRLIGLGNLIKKQIPQFYYDNLSKLDLTQYKLAQYEPLIIDRVKSLLQLLQDVFLKQIRRLNYSRVYESKEHEYRRISNLSKELTEPNLKKSIAKLQVLPNCPIELQKPYLELLGSELTDIINEAAAFGTNLWFTEDDVLNQMLNKLIVSGQFNMCFNLLIYTLELQCAEAYSLYSEETKTKLDNLVTKLISDWKRFVQSPYFMINSQGGKSV